VSRKFATFPTRNFQAFSRKTKKGGPSSRKEASLADELHKSVVLLAGSSPLEWAKDDVRVGLRI
jgi:hypothetical protein